MKSLSSEKGATLIEMSVALAIFAALGFFVFSTSIDLFKNIRLGQTSSTRTQLVAEIRQKVASVKDLRTSLSQPGNEQLRSCVCGGGPNCPSGVALPFTMYDQSAGSSAINRFYNSEGNPCDQNATNCVFQVTVQFISQCLPVMPSTNPTPAADCGISAAELIGINYTIGPNPLVVDPNDAYTNRIISGSVIHKVSEVNALGSGACL